MLVTKYETISVNFIVKCQYCSTRLKYTFRIVVATRSPHFILLGLSRDEHHLYFI